MKVLLRSSKLLVQDFCVRAVFDQTALPSEFVCLQFCQ